jgi:hypothetical protein
MLTLFKTAVALGGVGKWWAKRKAALADRDTLNSRAVNMVGDSK